MTKTKTAALCFLLIPILLALEIASAEAAVPARAGSAFSPSAVLQKQSGSAELSVRPNGDGVFAWIGYSKTNYMILATVKPAGLPDAVTEPLLIAAIPDGQQPSDPTIVTAADGTSTIVWQTVDDESSEGFSRTYFARIAADNSVSEPTELEDMAGEPRFFDSPMLAIDSRGWITVAWDRSVQTADDFASSVRALRISPDGEVSPALDLTEPADDVYEFPRAMGVDADDTVGVAYGSRPVEASNAPIKLGVQTINALGDLGEGGIARHLTYDYYPAISGGRLFAGDVRGKDDPSANLEMVSFDATHPPSDTVTLDSGHNDFLRLGAGTDESGNTYVTWQTEDGPKRKAPGAAVAMRVSPSGQTGKPRTMSRGPKPVRNLETAVDSSGAVYAIWTTFGKQPFRAGLVTAAVLNRKGRAQLTRYKSEPTSSSDVGSNAQGDAWVAWGTPGSDGRALIASRSDAEQRVAK